MKKILSAVLSAILVLTCFPFTALAESANLGEDEINVEYGSVTYFDNYATTLFETLCALAQEGIIASESGQSFDLDRNGSVDLIANNNSYTDLDGGTSYSTEFSMAQTKSVIGKIEFVIPQTINDVRKADGKDYFEKITVVFEDLCTDGLKHNWVQGTKKATFGKTGYTYARCTKCQKKEMGFPILAVNASMASTSYVYDGKAKKPKVSVSTYDGPLDQAWYKVEYLNNVKAGTASVKVTLIGDYFEGTKTFKFKISKAKNPMTVKAKTSSVKFSELKKKNQTVLLKEWAKISKAQGKLTCKKVSGNKAITVAKNGKITVKKGLKKGTYKLKVKVTAAGSTSYKALTKTVKVTIVIK